MQKHILKEYVELLALEWLSRSEYAPKLIFIGGTNLRLVQGIDRFSEDLDFDCKQLSDTEFIAMTDALISYLRLQGVNVEVRDRDTSRLKAFRRNIYFPELLFDLRLTGHREERFLMKIEAQDQGIAYLRELATVNRSGFFFPVAVPPLSVLLSMKLSALLTRQKGRDFYDTIFLLSKTRPNMDFLAVRTGIASLGELKTAVLEHLKQVDLNQKKRDFAHLLFNESNAERILQFPTIIEGMEE